MPRAWNDKRGRACDHIEHGLLARRENKEAGVGVVGNARSKQRSHKAPRGRARDEQAVRR